MKRGAHLGVLGQAVAAFALLAAAGAAGAQTETTEVSLSVGGDDRVRLGVPSSADRYHVLYYRSDPEDAETERAVAIHMGAAGRLELSEPSRVGAAGAYRVATYLKTDPADTDGDGVDDLAELARDGVHLRAPLTPASTLDGDGNEFTLDRGAIAVPDLETFRTLSLANGDPDLSGGLLYSFKFFIIDADDREDAYVISMNVNYERLHYQYWTNVLRRSRSEYYSSSVLPGDFYYYLHVASPAGTPGTFVHRLWRDLPFRQAALAHDVLTANVPFLRNNLVYRPANLARYLQHEKALYDASRVLVYLGRTSPGTPCSRP